MKTVFLCKKLFFLFLLINVSFNLIQPDIPMDHKIIKCTLTKIDRTSQHQSYPRIPSAIQSKGFISYSTNWSGYAVETNFNNPALNVVSSVSGSWIVPSVKTVNGQSYTYCSIWVGIDGYSNDTVEQIGTEHDCINGVEKSYAWFEMYPKGSYLINGFPLKIGDVISASIIYKDNVFIMQLHNNTQKVSTTVPTTYTRSTKAQRSSAEWIVEAPYLYSVLPLANFGTIYMVNCSATLKGISGNINSSAWANIPIEMITNTGVPKATPSSLGNNGIFTVSWAHS